MRNLEENIYESFKEFFDMKCIKDSLIKINSNEKKYESFDLIKNNKGEYMIIYEERGVDNCIFTTNNLIEAIVVFVKTLEEFSIIKPIARKT